MSVWPAWEVQEHGGATSWFHVRLAFTDGARVEAMAVVNAGRVSIEDVKAQPALSLADLTVLADWIEGPLFEACGVATEDVFAFEGEGDAGPEERGPGTDGGEEDVLYGGSRRARPSWPRGIEGRWLCAEEYRAAQEEGADPVLAVMSATGHSRRRSLRLIAQARDAGFLTPRHARR
ncbi:hypothetical protein LK07_30925 [Streptomyces pluripotens]|uniref:Uncharacterized protein n=1 Tax=Streptomyces pluripotens TaxID=1355015 RepID=A0A221P676_9ACTN|nr:DUF6214 family protein [Streptomyces pluripotens]ARP73466.1 hypothetical protein LK06_029730 [Streptomyces pluripotens]ASN27717.1 hypothetical protein LK07_30925 [Streptomyces pluripotens]